MSLIIVSISIVELFDFPTDTDPNYLWQWYITNLCTHPCMIALSKVSKPMGLVLFEISQDLVNPNIANRESYVHVDFISEGTQTIF